MVTPHLHRTSKQPPRIRIRLNVRQLVDRRRLRNRDVIKHTQRANNEPTQHQPRDRHIRQIQLNQQIVLIAQPAQLILANRKMRQHRRQHQRNHSASQRRRRLPTKPMHQIQDQVQHRRAAHNSQRQRRTAMQQRRDQKHPNRTQRDRQTNQRPSTPPRTNQHNR